MSRKGKIFSVIIKKLLRAALLLLCVSALAFALVSVSPVDPLQANVGQTALGSMSAEQIAKLESYWGVNTPPLERYFNWLGDFLRGDMGESLIYRQPVSAVIGERLVNSLWLMAFAWVFSGVVGFALGVAAGANRGGALDKGVRGYSIVMASIPTFWLALLLMMVFAVGLRALPVGLSVPIGMSAGDVTAADRLRHALLPALTLGLAGISAIALHTREKTADVMSSDFALFAAARGEGRGTIALRHGTRNVLLPFITLQFASISEIFGGSVLVEQVFSYPGIGQAAVAAGLGGDVPLLLGITVISATIVFCGNLAADILYGVIDPRIRRGWA